jgi:hypothetical protein
MVKGKAVVAWKFRPVKDVARGIIRVSQTTAVDGFHDFKTTDGSRRQGRMDGRRDDGGVGRSGEERERC